MDVVTVFERLGFPVAIIVVTGVSLYRGAKFLAERLIGDHGILIKLANRHIDFLDHLQGKLDDHSELFMRNTECLERITKCLEENGKKGNR